MKGMHNVYEAIGEYPVYPGHPLVIAYEIMTVFPSPAAALETYRAHGLNCPTAVTDSRISGGGGEVQAACDLIRKAKTGMPVEDLVAWANERWNSSKAGGHDKAVEPGLAQATKLKAAFAERLPGWLNGDAQPSDFVSAE